jgi:dTDP-4-dehydrorhamnose 3,5-epimerase
MKVAETALPGVLLLEPSVHRDARGFFFESWNARTFRAATGVAAGFVQDNHSRSGRGVLRGLHYQVRQPQGKIVRVVQGAIYDVAVDLRKSSPAFGRWVGQVLSGDNRLQMWVPPGFAHGFLVLTETADVLYKVTDYHAPRHERCLRWNDRAVGVSWPLEGVQPVLSARDAAGEPLEACEAFD